MSSKKNIPGTIPGTPENPFRVPDGYFENFKDRLMDRIHQEQVNEPRKSAKKINLRPFIGIAAAIAGISLAIYILLQTVSVNQNHENIYDIAFLEKNGIFLDESILVEELPLSDDFDLNEWDEDVLVYLASNEVDLLTLLETN